VDNEANEVKKDDKWEFEDYAFTITGVIVGALLVLPELAYSLFGIHIFGGSLVDAADMLAESIEHGGWTLNQLRVLSPMLFLLTTTIAFFYDAIEARKTGGYKGSLFTHTFESLLDDAIYMAITTIMVYGSIFFGVMYASWLGGPVAWVLFVAVFPLVRKKGAVSGEDGHIHEGSDAGQTAPVKTRTPWFLLSILAIGIVVEVLTGAWIAFPLSWLIICVLKLAQGFRARNFTADIVFDMVYYAFSVILLAGGLVFDFWLASWGAFPLALIVSWGVNRFKPRERGML